MRLSGCVESLFLREHGEVVARMRACAGAGLEAVEFWLWRDKDLDAIARVLGEMGLALSGFCAEPRLAIVDPATHGDWLAGVRESLAVARRLGAPALIVLSGDEIPGVARGAQQAAVVAALRAAAGMAEDAGVKLLLEPLNIAKDHVGYFVHSTAAGLDMVEAVGSPAVGLLYDVYHSAMMGERQDEVLAGRGHLVGHVHVADVNGRHEPGSGTIDWAARMRGLREIGYTGAIGLEFWPTGGTVDALARTRALLGK
jgi:hydroxypyruvate isomerase